jgi:hypothetical protein
MRVTVALTRGSLPFDPSNKGAPPLVDTQLHSCNGTQMVSSALVKTTSQNLLCYTLPRMGWTLCRVAEAPSHANEVDTLLTAEVPSEVQHIILSIINHASPHAP